MKVGDYVIWDEGTAYTVNYVWGKITEITDKGSVRVQPFNKNQPSVLFRRLRGGRYDFRLATQQDIEQRRWRLRRPKTLIVHLSGIDRGSEIRAEALVRASTYPEFTSQLDQAAAELLSIKAWLEQKPKEANDDAADQTTVSSPGESGED